MRSVPPRQGASNPKRGCAEACCPRRCPICGGDSGPVEGSRTLRRCVPYGQVFGPTIDSRNPGAWGGAA